MSSAPKYKLRNRLLESLGEFTTKEILARIAEGKLTGEEEISLPSSEDWQKIASHPVFYDAFIKRVLAQYQTPSSDPYAFQKSVSESKPASDPGETRQQAPSSSLESEKAPAEAPRARDHTLHQSDIDELFSRSTPEEASLRLGKAGKTDLILLEPPDPQPDASQTEPPPPSSPPSFSSPGLDRRKKILLAGVALLALYFLFPSSQSPIENLKTDSTTAPALGNFGSEEERALTLGEEAKGLIAQDSKLFYEGAFAVLQEALAIDPTNAVLLSRFAIAGARRCTDPETTETLKPVIQSAIQKARTTDPHSSELYRAEAILAMAERRWDSAKALAYKAAEADPLSSENLLLVAELHLAGGANEEAYSVLKDAAQAKVPSVRALYLLARTLWERKEIQSAHGKAIEALKLNPLHPPTYLLLADIASDQNQFKEARGLYETCGRLARFTTKEISGRAYFRLGELHELAGQTAEAQNSYQLAYFYLNGGNSALKEKVKGLDVSEALLKRMAAQTEYSSSYFQEQGTGLLNQGKVQEAELFFQAAHLLAPKDGMALIQLGEVKERTAASYEDFRRVMSYYQRAIDRDPKQPMGYIKLGLLESEQYNFDRGYKLLMQAVSLDPESEKPYVALGKHYYKRQDYSEALNRFLQASKINPSDSEILYYAGKLRLVYKKDGARDAAKFFSQAYTVDPRNYDALAEWLKLKVVNYEKNFAIKFANNLITAEPTNAALYWVLGEVYSENKEFRRAIAFYHRALDLDNRQSKVRMSLAKALEAVGELDKAVAEFRLASLLDRRNSEGFYRAADLLFQMKSYHQSEEVLRYLLSVTPNYPGVYRYLSKIHQLRDQKDPAVESLEREVASNPQNIKFVLELAELLLEYGRVDRAIEELKKVTLLPSGDKAPEYKQEKVRAFLLLSRSYRAKNQFESAEGAVRLALGLDPNDPELHRELGYVYYSMQRDKEGVKAFEFYLERAPAARDAATIRGLIKKMVIEE